jgi:hypothetical protein
MQAAREAALRPGSAELYPYLPVRMWTSAAHLAGLVARHLGAGEEVRDRSNRVLSEAHFEFRGEESDGHEVS